MSRKNLAVQLDGVDSTRAPTIVRHKLSCILRGYRDCGQLPLISLALIAVSHRVGAQDDVPEIGWIATLYCP
jgi:hypothetical protein